MLPPKFGTRVRVSRSIGLLVLLLPAAAASALAQDPALAGSALVRQMRHRFEERSQRMPMLVQRTRTLHTDRAQHAPIRYQAPVSAPVPSVTKPATIHVAVAPEVQAPVMRAPVVRPDTAKPSVERRSAWTPSLVSGATPYVVAMYTRLLGRTLHDLAVLFEGSTARTEGRRGLPGSAADTIDAESPPFWVGRRAIGARPLHSVTPAEPAHRADDPDCHARH